jgi:putative SOS response-associated peptidase YedK
MWRQIHLFGCVSEIAGNHTWMPVIFPEERPGVWLAGEAGKEILTTFPAERMKARAISPRVNSPRNYDAELIEPIHA